MSWRPLRLNLRQAWLAAGVGLGLLTAPAIFAGPNVPWKTMGGPQFWADVAVRSEWRVQRNVTTGHHRLLDPSEVRRAWGSADHCLRALDASPRATAARGEVVVMLHGTFSHRRAMKRLGEYLEAAGSVEVVNVGYPSTRAGISTHAADLAAVIDRLGPEVTRIHFAAHSLGNLVVREYLRDPKLSKRLIDSGRLGRFAMITPPNQGADLARLFEHVPGFQVVMKGVGQDLICHDLDQRLGTPPCAFGIIVGGKGNKPGGYNPLLRGDDDLILRVSETHLDGAAAVIFFRKAHKPMLSHKPAQAATLRFLQTGAF